MSEQHTTTSSLEGKTALVTGAASGIGLAIAQAMSAEGARVILTDQPSSALTQAAESLKSPSIGADLSQAASCQQLLEQLGQHSPRVDILVNNAGVQRIHPLERFPLNEWQMMIDLMLTAPFLLTQGLWASMRQNGFGRVINIASIHALVASPYKSAYVSAKHGLLGLTKTAALEGGEHGITVNALCPAYVQTPLVERQIQAQATEHGLDEQAVIEQIMLQPAAIKRLIQPEEIAKLCLFLCSPAGGAVTGASWQIDLGWTAR